VRWHAAIALLRSFLAVFFFLTARRALPLTDWKEMALKRFVACHAISFLRAGFLPHGPTLAGNFALAFVC
jgi:hypothetical protein